MIRPRKCGRICPEYNIIPFAIGGWNAGDLGRLFHSYLSNSGVYLIDRDWRIGQDGSV
jgi:hypothetical protein